MDIDSKTGLWFPVQTCAACKPDGKHINPLDAECQRCVACDRHYACAQCLVCPRKFLRQQRGVGNACCDEHNVQPVALVTVSIYPHERQLPTFSCSNIQVKLPITRDALLLDLINHVTVDQFLAASTKTVSRWTDDFETGDSFSDAQRTKYSEKSFRDFVASVAANDFSCDDKVTKFFPRFPWNDLTFNELNARMDFSVRFLDSFVLSLCRGTDRTMDRIKNIWNAKTEMTLLELVDACGEIVNGQVRLNVHLLQSTEAPIVRVPIPVGRPEVFIEEPAARSKEKVPVCHNAIPWLEQEFGFTNGQAIAALGRVDNDLGPVAILNRLKKIPVVQQHGRFYVATVHASKSAGIDFVNEHDDVFYLSEELVFSTSTNGGNGKMMKVLIFQFAAEESARLAFNAIYKAGKAQGNGHGLSNYLNRCFLALAQMGHGRNFNGTDSPHMSELAEHVPLPDAKPKRNRRTRKRTRKDEEEEDEEEEEEEDEEYDDDEHRPMNRVGTHFGHAQRDFNEPSIEDEQQKKAKMIEFDDEQAVQLFEQGLEASSRSEPMEVDLLRDSIENFHGLLV